MTVQPELIDFLSKYDTKVSALCMELREHLFKTLPDIQEQLDIPARIIGYGYGSKYAESICAIILSKKGIKLGFYKGSELPDPAKILPGSGKVHRYVEINLPADIRSSALKKLLTAALKAYKKRSDLTP